MPTVLESGGCPRAGTPHTIRQITPPRKTGPVGNGGHLQMVGRKAGGCSAWRSLGRRGTDRACLKVFTPHNRARRNVSVRQHRGRVFRPKTPVNTYRANPVPPGGHLWKIGGPAEQRPKERGVRQKAEGRLGRTAAFGRPFGDHTRIAPPAAASAVESHSLG